MYVGTHGVGRATVVVNIDWHDHLLSEYGEAFGETGYNRVAEAGTKHISPGVISRGMPPKCLGYRRPQSYGESGHENGC